VLSERCVASRGGTLVMDLSKHLAACTGGYAVATAAGGVRLAGAPEPALQNYLQQLEGLALCSELRQFVERVDGVTYKWAVRARYDTLWDVAATESGSGRRHSGVLPPRDIHALTVPEHQAHGGHNDKFAVGLPP
jgi:hypothetical protein